MQVIPLATDNVLKTGIGSEFNLPIYNGEKVKYLTAIDPSIEIWNKNNIDTEKLPFEFTLKIETFFQSKIVSEPITNISTNIHIILNP